MKRFRPVMLLAALTGMLAVGAAKPQSEAGKTQPKFNEREMQRMQETIEYLQRRVLELESRIRQLEEKSPPKNPFQFRGDQDFLRRFRPGEDFRFPEPGKKPYPRLPNGGYFMPLNPGAEK